MATDQTQVQFPHISPTPPTTTVQPPSWITHTVPIPPQPQPHQVANPVAHTAGSTFTPMSSSAQAMIGRLLEPYGLPQLGAWAWREYLRLGGGQGALDQITLELPEQQAFKARFPAYDAMLKQGEGWTPAQIMSYEQSARDQLNQLGIGHLYSNQELQGLLAGGVSINELGQRVTLAQTYASSPHPVKDQLQTLYGLSDKQVASYWFDPERSLTAIQQQFASAETAGEAQIAGYGQLSKDEAEQLSTAGITGPSARTAFSTLANAQGLFTPQADETQGISRDQQIGYALGNASAQQAFKQRQASRTAQFTGAAGYSVTGAGVSGLGNQSQ